MRVPISSGALAFVFDMIEPRRAGIDAKVLKFMLSSAFTGADFCDPGGWGLSSLTAVGAARLSGGRWPLGYRPKADPPEVRNGGKADDPKIQRTKGTAIRSSALKTLCLLLDHSVGEGTPWRKSLWLRGIQNGGYIS